MSLKDDLETLAHELECDPTYNFKGLMTSDGDKFPDKLARVRDGIARIGELEANAKQREDLIQDNRERIQVLKNRVEELEAERDRCRAALETVREEISGCLKRDTDAFAQMTLDQIEHWNVSRHMQSHGYCIDQIDTAINPPKEA